MDQKTRVLMIGPDRDVKGGISTVVNCYYDYGLNDKVDLCYLPTMKDGNKIIKLITAIRSYVVFCKKVKKCDIVHIHMAAQASFDRKSFFVKKAYKAGKKIIIHQHAADFDRYFFEQSSEKKRKKIIRIFKLADKIIVLSEEWAVFFGKNICNPSKIIIIYNGVVIPQCGEKEYNNHNVLMLGRIGKRKGTYDLLKIVPGIISEIDDVKFFLGGDGDIEKCKKIVNENNLNEHVFFLGWVSGKQKEEFFNKCSVFILPSYNEGMPMALLEAMSYGLAPISTNAGGIPQIIEQGKNGIRVEAGNVQGLSTAIIRVLKNEGFRKQLGQAARNTIISKFDFLININHLVEVYAELEMR